MRTSSIYIALFLAAHTLSSALAGTYCPVENVEVDHSFACCYITASNRVCNDAASTPMCSSSTMAATGCGVSSTHKKCKWSPGSNCYTTFDSIVGSLTYRYYQCNAGCIAQVACPACNPVFYNVGCAGTNSGTCTQCTDCSSSGMYTTNCDGEVGPGTCAECTKCNPGYYNLGCGGVSPGACTQCDPCPDTGTYKNACNGTSPGICSPCVNPVM